jgi:hypothetical protein
MGKTGALAIVTPTEFKERTALTFSSRSTSTQVLDNLYAEYHRTRGTAQALALYAALTQYRDAHGKAWNKCERNTASGGLLEYLHNMLGPGGMSDVSALAHDRNAADLVRKFEIPRARYGVLYFLANIKLDIDTAGAVIETLSSVGGAVGTGVTTNFGALGSKSAVGTAMAVPGPKGPIKLSASQVATGGKMGAKAVQTVVNKMLAPSKTKSGPAPTVMQRYMPATLETLEVATKQLSEIYSKNRYVGGAAYVAAGILAPAAVVVTAAVDLGRFVFDKIMAAFKALGDALIRLWRTRYSLAVAQQLAFYMKKATLFAVDLVMKNAVPFLGGAVDLGTGLARTIDLACKRIVSWSDRRGINIHRGHPEEIANAIEHQMTMGLCGGLVDMLKGASSIALSTFLPGLGGLVSAVVGAIEWLVRLMSRVAESLAIDKFLARARDLYALEKNRATASKVPVAKGRQDVTVYEPNVALKNTLLTSTEKFRTFFQEGCNASPLIPMLTLNSGLGGSLMTLIDLFDENGSQSTRLSGGKKDFDRGAAYFDRLKRFSVGYMKKSGFQFLPLVSTDDLMSGYLAHATGMGKERQSHAGLATAGGRAVAFATA